MGIYDFTVYDLINRNAVGFKDKLAWFEVDDERTLSFKQYKEVVDRLACGLQKIGIKKGDRIGVLGKNSMEFFILYGAAAATGAIVLPINWRLSNKEVSYNLTDCTPVALFIDKEFQENIQTIRESLTSVHHFYNLKAGEGNFENFNGLLDNSGTVEFTEVLTDDGYVIIHTAAVSGKPRGALLSHGNLLCANIHFNLCFCTTPLDVHLNLLPLFHVGGLMMAAHSFHAGALNINMSKFDAKKAVLLIEEKKVSILFDFSPILSSILETQKKEGKNIGSLRAVMGLDTPETIEQYQKTTGGIFYAMYGQTETSCLATTGKYDDRPGSAGKTIHLAEVRLIDEYDNRVAVGDVGEITVKGPMIFKGYWNLPEDNAFTFRDGWHHTGDLGRFDEDGFLWYAGRKAEKELIKPGGENVYPAEVEKAILLHPLVTKAVVFGVPDPKWKEGIKAVCQLAASKKLDPKDLIAFVGERIASFKKPQYVEFVTSMPANADGTIDRDKIKTLYGGEQKK